jgi:hypothetical protein
MPLIQESVFTGYADRIAGQFRILRNAVSAMSAGATYFQMLTVTDDPDIEIPMLSPARTQDLFTQNEDSVVSVVKQMPAFTGLITAMESHMKTQTENFSVVGWDTYCTASGVRVGEYTDWVHYARYGRHMLARNVFSENEITFAECSISPSGTMQFEDVDDFGTGSYSVKAGAGNYSGTQLAAVLGNEITQAIDIEIVGVGETGLTRRQSTTGGLIVGPSGTRIPIPPPSGRFVDVTEVNLLSGGSSGDIFLLVNIIERDTTL